MQVWAIRPVSSPRWPFLWCGPREYQNCCHTSTDKRYSGHHEDEFRQSYGTRRVGGFIARQDRCVECYSPFSLCVSALYLSIRICAGESIAEGLNWLDQITLLFPHRAFAEERTVFVRWVSQKLKILQINSFSYFIEYVVSMMITSLEHGWNWWNWSGSSFKVEGYEGVCVFKSLRTSCWPHGLDAHHHWRRNSGHYCHHCCLCRQSDEINGFL